ncbi:Uncharacterised protein [Mycobacteroides abscessus subsp. abscessus]|nr:Uncharacterised protein [Mycobacteroides abscessus subsp. abscessus]
MASVDYGNAAITYEPSATGVGRSNLAGRQSLDALRCSRLAAIYQTAG